MKSIHALLWGFLAGAIITALYYGAFCIFNPSSAYTATVVTVVVFFLIVFFWLGSLLDEENHFVLFMLFFAIVGLSIILYNKYGAYEIRSTSSGKAVYVSNTRITDSTYVDIKEIRRIVTDCSAFGTSESKVSPSFTTLNLLLLYRSPNKFDWIITKSLLSDKVHTVDCDSMRIEKVSKTYTHAATHLKAEISAIRYFRDGEGHLISFESDSIRTEMKYERERPEDIVFPNM